MFSVGTLLGPRIAFAWKARPAWNGLRTLWPAYGITACHSPALQSLLFVARRSGLGAESLLVASGYGTTFALWLFACLIVGLFRFGFRWFLVSPTCNLAPDCGIQVISAFSFVLTLLFVASVYVVPNGPQVAAGVGLAVWPSPLCSCFSMKYIGQAVQEDDLSGAARRVEQALFLAPPDTDD